MSEQVTKEAIAFICGQEQGVLEERERNLYTLKITHEELLDKAQFYNQLGQYEEMLACKVAARYIAGAIEKIMGREQ